MGSSRRLSRIEMRAGRRREVSARGKAHHANSIGGKAELLGAGADEADRALRVAELDRMVVAGPSRYLRTKAVTPAALRRFAHLPSFVIGRERAVATAWRDDDRGARWLARAVERQRRPVPIVADRAPPARRPASKGSFPARRWDWAWLLQVRAGACA